MHISIPTYLAGATQTKAYRLLRQEVYAALSSYDLNPTIWSMLGIIDEARDGIRQVDIASSLNVKAPLITTMSRTLQARDLIRVVTNQFDARAKLLATTPAGKKFVKEVDEALGDSLAKLLRGVTHDDMQAYEKVLKTIIQNSESKPLPA